MLGPVAAHFVADVVGDIVAFAVAGVTGITELRTTNLAGQQFVPAVRPELARPAFLSDDRRHDQPLLKPGGRPTVSRGASTSRLRRCKARVMKARVASSCFSNG